MQQKAKDIIAKALEVIEQYTTRLTIRQIYYRLVSVHLIENKVSEYQAVVQALKQARLDGLIPYESIEDRTRAFIGHDYDLETPEEHFNGAKSYFEKADEYYNLPVWLNQPEYVEVWLEKQALAALFEQVTNKFNVRLAPCRGYPSLTFLWEGAQHLQPISEVRHVNILYFGDFDPSGQDIPRYIEQRLTEDLGIDTESMEFTKIAITPEQIEQYNIPPMPVKMTDSRGAAFAAEHGAHSAVELDALDPKVLQKMIEQEIVRYLDMDILKQRNEQEKEGRAQIKGMVAKALGEREAKRQHVKKRKKK